MRGATPKWIIEERNEKHSSLRFYVHEHNVNRFVAPLTVDIAPMMSYGLRDALLMHGICEVPVFRFLLMSYKDIEAIPGMGRKRVEELHCILKKVIGNYRDLEFKMSISRVAWEMLNDAWLKPPARRRIASS